MSRTKRRIKKFLKRALPAAALIGGAAMLGQRRRNQANVEMDLPTSNMTDRPTMADVAGKIQTTVPTPKAKPFEIITPKPNRNMKSIFVGDDGSITKGNMKFPNKESYSSYMQEQRRRPSKRVPGQAGIMTGDLGGAFDYLEMKDGGKVVKTGDEPKKRKKKVSIQIKGFGKARRG